MTRFSRADEFQIECLSYEEKFKKLKELMGATAYVALLMRIGLRMRWEEIAELLGLSAKNKGKSTYTLVYLDLKRAAYHYSVEIK